MSAHCRNPTFKVTINKIIEEKFEASVSLFLLNFFHESCGILDLVHDAKKHTEKTEGNSLDKMEKLNELCMFSRPWWITPL